MHQLVSMGTLTIIVFSEPVGHVDRLLDLDYCLYIRQRMGDLKGLNPQEPVRHGQTCVYGNSHYKYSFRTIKAVLK